MHQGVSLLAIIPARGGSKGLPGKNIMPCAGKPLIAWSIEAALGAGTIDDVVVSTDEEAITNVARKYGASVPFLRPRALASDDASVLDVVRHAWQRHRTPGGSPFDYVVLLQPTSPLRHSGYVRDAVRSYFERRDSDRDTLASVVEVSPKYGWLMEPRPGTPHIRFCFDVNANRQRQRLGPLYLPNGAIFILKGASLDEEIYRDCTLPFVMPAADSVDVDVLEDLVSAERALRARRST